ncbi:hypothetical protein M0812_25173 [Anaeramoeba flamelloides]|uniref:PAS domain-containing protein n=1 Tax=Anaeramoeba flamelloides TaxID=1746091 RepID=A0AAV7YPE4_9EUKA|nr:hypothetical protein M0812_25173 [Anaeramoeba flamelloides]
MGMPYSSYKKKETIRKKTKIRDFYKLIDHANFGVALLNEKNEISMYNPFMRKLCSLSQDEIKSNTGNSPVKNNKPGGKGTLNLYQPQYNQSAPTMFKAVFEEIDQNNTAELIVLHKNTKNPKNLFFAKTYVRKIQIGKQTFTLISSFPINGTPLIDPFNFKQDQTIKQIEPKKPKEKNTKNKQKENKNQILKKPNSRNFNRPIYYDSQLNFNSKNNSEPSIVELESDSDHKEYDIKNYKLLNNYNDKTEDKVFAYNSCVEPMTDLENEPKEDYFFKNQNQKQTQSFLTCAFIMNKLISLNYNHSNSSSVKNSKSILNEINSKTNDFKGGIFKKGQKTQPIKKKPKTKKNQISKKNKTDNKRNKRKNRNNNKNRNNRKTDNNNKKKSKNKKPKNKIQINITNIHKNTTINNIHNSTTINNTNTINNFINKNNTNFDNNTKINNMMKNINKTPNRVKNNTIKSNKIDKVTIKNTIYQFLIEDDQKLETDLENILPSSEEIDNIFQEYEL